MAPTVLCEKNGKNSFTKKSKWDKENSLMQAKKFLGFMQHFS